MTDLKPCPCGLTPDNLVVMDAGQGGKWANVAGNCCGEWEAGFRTSYEPLDSDKCMSYAKQAWNDLPRADTSPALTDDVQTLCNKLEHSAAHRINHPGGSQTLKPACYLCGEAKTMLERLARENEQLLQNINRLVKSNDNLRRVLGDKRAKVEELEAKVEAWENPRPNGDVGQMIEAYKRKVQQKLKEKG